MECIEVTNSNSINVNETTLNYSVGRHGDLLYKCHLEIDFPQQGLTGITGVAGKYGTYCNNTAHSYVKQIDFEIGKKLIDRHYGLWYDIRNSLWDKDNRKSLLNKHDDKNTYLISDDTDNVKSLKFLSFHFGFVKIQVKRCH